MDSKAPENIMGTMPVSRLIIRNGAPLILSLLANTLYNFVDSVFVSHVNEKALTALMLASPVQMLMGSLGGGIAIGLNAAVSKALGAKNLREVRETASAAMLMGVAASLLIAVSCLVAIVPYFQWQATGDVEIAAYGVSYMRVCMLFSLGVMGQWVFDRFLIATGKSMLFLATLGCAAGVNLILDPLFIFGYFGLPAMGTTGAAIATVIAQFSGALLGVVLNVRFNKEIPLVFTLRVRFSCVANILRVGIPRAVTQSAASFMGIFLNTILIGFSSTAVAVFGVCSRAGNIVTIGVHGINNGLIPIVAYNYGAKRHGRIEESVKWALIYSFVIMLLMCLPLELWPAQILRLFDASEYMTRIGVPAIRIMAFSYVISSFCFVMSALFQALGRGMYSMYLTLGKQAVLLLLAAFFARTGNLNFVWTAFILTEFLLIPPGLYLLGRVRKRILNTLEVLK
jgi:putative MATE family efflux protein